MHPASSNLETMPNTAARSPRSPASARELYSRHQFVAGEDDTIGSVPLDKYLTSATPSRAFIGGGKVEEQQGRIARAVHAVRFQVDSALSSGRYAATPTKVI